MNQQNPTPPSSAARETIDGKPVIPTTNTSFTEYMPEVLAIIRDRQAKNPLVFQQRGGILVRIRDGGQGQIEQLTFSSLRTIIDRAVVFAKEKGRGWVKLPAPPDPLITGILTADHWEDLPELPELRRLAEAPYFTVEGTLVSQSGYHAGARTFLRLDAPLRGMSPLPLAPTPSQLKAACRLLTDDLLVDFPFSNPSSLAHMLAMLITPFVREIIGTVNVPGVVITAPIVGSGKTKLVNLASMITVGEPVEVMAAEIKREEVEKRVTAILLAARPYGVFDNAVDRIDSPQLAALLTNPTWTGRILGESKMAQKLPNATQWVVTGNKLSFTDEMARRFLTISLTPKEQRPNLRTGFKHDPLETWIAQNRAALVHAILTIVQHWLAVGRPLFTARVLGSYEAYAQIIGGILQAAGLDEGFLTPTKTDNQFNTPATAQEKDGDADLHTLVIAWSLSHIGYTLTDSKTLLDIAPKGMFAHATDPVSALGRLVKKSAGRIIAGHRILCIPTPDDAGRKRNRFRITDDLTVTQPKEEPPA